MHNQKSCSLETLPFSILTSVVPDKFNLLPDAGKPKKSPVCVPLKLKYLTILSP